LIRIPPDQGLADCAMPGRKGVKTCLTYVFTVNADGSDKHLPLVIGKAAQPHTFRRLSMAALGFNYMLNAKAWMTSAVYWQWITQWDHELQRENHKILLFQDSFKGHKAPKNLSNIMTINFAPDLTPFVQPLDVGIIQNFKAHYRHLFISSHREWGFFNPSSNHCKGDFKPLKLVLTNSDYNKDYISSH
jgi:hypothetical protein